MFHQVVGGTRGGVAVTHLGERVGLALVVLQDRGTDRSGPRDEPLDLGQTRREQNRLLNLRVVRSRAEDRQLLTQRVVDDGEHQQAGSQAVRNQRQCRAIDRRIGQLLRGDVLRLVEGRQELEQLRLLHEVHLENNFLDVHLARAHVHGDRGVLVLVDHTLLEECVEQLRVRFDGGLRLHGGTLREGLGSVTRRVR